VISYNGPVDTIRIHQCISGFTQDERRPHGVLRLAEKLHALGFNNRVSRVSLRRWNDDWSDVAEYYWLLGQEHQAHVVVNIYGYSWGVGWGAIQLARELQKRSISVHQLVSADGVYRHAWFRLPSMLGRDSSCLAPKIRVPSNVRIVTPFHQTINRPQGHVIVGEADFTGIIQASRELQATHQYLDDAAEFHDASISAAQALQGVN
jgi:hypothetical protein